MTDSRTSILKIPSNPLNLRGGAQYGRSDKHNSRATPDERTVQAERENHTSQTRRNGNKSRVRRDESAYQAESEVVLVGPEGRKQNSGSNAPSALSDTNTGLVKPLPVLKAPYNPVNLRRGAKYRRSQLPSPSLTVEDHRTSEPEPEQEQEVHSEEYTSEDLRPVDNHKSIQEWYSDDQISDFISYARESLTSPPTHPPSTFYNISTHAGPQSSYACEMLREAARTGLAQLARSSDLIELYTIAAPPPVDPVGLSEHWWRGLTDAQIRAGPLAGDRQIRNAERNLQRNTIAKRNRKKWLEEQRQKTAEGVRRQKKGVRMNNSEDEDGM